MSGGLLGRSPQELVRLLDRCGSRFDFDGRVWVTLCRRPVEQGCEVLRLSSDRLGMILESPDKSPTVIWRLPFDSAGEALAGSGFDLSEVVEALKRLETRVS